MSYVRNAWYVASWSTDLAVGKPQGLMILEEPIVIWRNDSGQVHALEDRCVHRLAPLSLGRCEGGNLRCMYHGFLYNEEGSVIGIPGQDMIPAAARVRRYPVVEQDGWIWVWMGDRELADEALIPRVCGPEDANWDLKCSHIDYAAEARLINDNLTDFSHLSFVHAASFAATESLASDLPTVTPIERGVRIDRWSENQRPLGSQDSQERIDVFISYDYLVPGILRLRARFFPAETFKRIGRIVPPDDIECLETYSAQAVTPTGHKETRYFFSNGIRKPVTAEFLDFFWQVTLQAFEEDRHIIQGQQRIVDMDPDHRIMPVAGDKATVLFNRIVNSLVKEERNADKADGSGARSNAVPQKEGV